QCLERIGGKETIQVDLRLIAATNKDLQSEIRKGTFRDDLYYRLNVIEVKVPPLRDRKDDIPLLVEHFLESLAKKYGKARPRLAGTSLMKLCGYHWPGNIRQLRNYLERITVLELGADLDRDVDTLVGLSAPGAAAAGPAEGPLESLEDVELKHIRRVLDATKGNRTQAAQILKIDAKTLRAKLKRVLEPKV
ncbi:MAG: sigma-54-dependent Fis family transcriptional regulator, partial [Candidatus Riflebacteria bacterium]|nr:sigma-54-dependent Fis family transcriptional regulator [Candidatus Riflebacteria bacterium]